MTQLYNFSPGPSKLPDSVISKASEAIFNYKPINSSILEITHRSKEFAKILENIEQNLIKILNIPDYFDILLLQGGATFQNALIPNNISFEKNIGCIVNGHWGLKTYEDFSKVLNNVELIEKSYETLETIYIEDYSKFNNLHITSNETINGIQIRELSKIHNANLIVDMSSDIGSYKLSFENIDYIYAGAQKNLGIPGVTLCIINKDFIKENSNPTYLNLYELNASKSLLNTPSTFSIFIFDLLLQWMIEMGGLEYFENKSNDQSSLIYEFLDSQNDKFTLLNKTQFRSKSNITFNFKNLELTNKFLEYTKQNGILGINGHRSVGGIRISLYNSITNEMVDYLISQIEYFLKQEYK
jgi:phosphoserine aminotransferase